MTAVPRHYSINFEKKLQKYPFTSTNVEVINLLKMGLYAEFNVKMLKIYAAYKHIFAVQLLIHAQRMKINPTLESVGNKYRVSITCFL